MKNFYKDRGPSLCLQLLVLINSIVFVAVLGDPSPPPPIQPEWSIRQQPGSTSWFTWGMGGFNSRTLNDNFPGAKRTSRNVDNIDADFSTLVDNVNSGFSTLVDRRESTCQEIGIPCSGHTRQSCASYCQSVGFRVSRCEGSCCLCSNSDDNNVMSDYMSQFQPLRTIQQTKPIVRKPIPTSTQSSNFYNRNEDLETQGSSNVLYQQWVNNYFKGYQFKNNSNKNNNNKQNQIATKPTELNHNSVRIHKQNDQAICQTEACLTASKQLQENMNPGVNPCDNFYEYACGGFVRNTRIPRDKTEVTAFSLLRDKVSEQLRTLFEEPLKSTDPKPFRLVKTLYQSCMNTYLIEELGTKPLKDVLEILGGWPVLEGNQWQPEFYTWANFVVWFREVGFPTDYFIKMSIEPDIKNVKTKVITLGEPVLGLSREVLIRGANEPAVNAYYKYMVEMAVLMGASRSTAEIEMLQVLNFEVELAKRFYRPENTRGSNYYYPMTLVELELKYPSVPWLQLFQRILPKKVSINSQEVVMVSVPQYLDGFFDLIARTDIRIQSNYAIWRAISSSVPYLHEAARRLQFDFSASITGQREGLPRWKECTDTVGTNLANAAGAMYIRRFFSKEAKAQAKEMVVNIQRGFLEILDEIDWMDESTRAKAKDKASNIKVHVGYPEEHLSDAKITALYSEYDFKSTDYFGNIRNLIMSATNLDFGALKTPFGKNDWVVHGKTAVVNAFYLPLENAIQFPAAVLQSSFFDSARPKYMNYGAIGWIAGHELSHGFDDQGHQFDRNGNYANWWDPFTKNTYTTKTQCIINQYGKYVPTGSEMKINGVNSQGENIADNGGIKQAYRAYQSWVNRNGVEKALPGMEKMSNNQLFWLSSANNWCGVYRPETLRHQILTGVHAPGEFRVRGTFANNPDFARDFSCPLGSRMNPVQKCSVW